VALALLAGGAWLIGQAVSPRQAALYLLGAALGLVLYHASFGFTSAWRVFVNERRGAGLRAQMAMLALAVVLFFPVLAGSTVFGQPVSAHVAPLGVGVAFGAFIFGLGMQLGGGCASGTLYTAGGGSVRMMVTLAAFILGSAVGAAHFGFWTSLPSLPGVSLVRSLGWELALVLNLAAFALIWQITRVMERRRHGRLLPEAVPARRGLGRLLRGPWPLLAGALLLAIGNFATLTISGRPWGITSAFALWGSKIFAALGGAPETWAYFAPAPMAKALHGSLLADVGSVMNFGIVAGALLAAGLAGRYRPEWRLPFRSLLAAILGGLLMGYGARQAYGCNIGAYFSGIAGGSVHAWLWLATAWLGSLLGTRLRPVFGLGG
jgi:uncharacterized membrane protein YedE/YeeE